MKKLLKRAKENLIEQAQEVNTNEASDNPVNTISAVDFDAEIQEVLGNQGANPADEGTGEPGPEPEEGEEAPALPKDNPETSEVAVERIVRLTRVLESLEEAHECGVVTPLLADLANDEVDNTARILNIEQPPAPALESQDNPDSRFQVTRARVIEMLKKAWEMLKKWWAASYKWYKDFRAAYAAQKGQYPRTLEGYRTRLKTFNGFSSDKTFEAKLGVMTHNGNDDSAQGAVDAAYYGTEMFMNITNACAKVPHAEILSLLTSMTNNTTEPEFPSPIRAFGIQTNSNKLALNAMFGSVYTAPSGAGPATFKITGVPGGQDPMWTFGQVNARTKDMNEMIRQLALFSFSMSAGHPAHTDVNITMSVDQGNFFLDAATEHMKASANVEKNMNLIQGMLTFLHKSIEDCLKALSNKVDDPQMGPIIQQMTRAIALWASAYERTYVRPAVEASRMINKTIDQLIRLSAEVVVHIEEETGNGKKDEA